MTSHELSSLQLIELDLIKKDVHFYFDLIVKLHKHKSSGILVPSLVPYFSLFTFETYKYFQSFYPEYAYALSEKSQAIISSSRMRIKFFDDTQKRVDGTFEVLDWISDLHYEWHINKHKGILAPIQRALQCDLGTFFYDRHLIGSTHTGIFNLGYSREDLPTASEEISSFIGLLAYFVGKEIGEYIAYIEKVLSFPEFMPDSRGTEYFAYNIQDNLLGYKDEKSKRLLASIFNGAISETINLNLLLFLTQVNFLQYILNNLVIGSPYTVFKLKYIVLYHLTSSLKKLQNHCYRKLADHSKKHLQTIISDTDLEQITSQRQFRNILVHYGVREVSNTAVSLTSEFYGLVEHFFGGKTYNEITDIVDNQLKRISKVLEEWLNWQVKPFQVRSWW